MARHLDPDAAEAADQALGVEPALGSLPRAPRVTVRRGANHVTPFRSHGKGTYVLKGTFGGVRIERATGTHDAKRLEDLRAMCRTLADAGRLDVLEQLRDGTLRLLSCATERSGSSIAGV